MYKRSSQKQHRLVREKRNFVGAGKVAAVAAVAAAAAAVAAVAAVAAASQRVGDARPTL